jgi:tRNA(Ile)-lysidine synthase
MIHDHPLIADLEETVLARNLIPRSASCLLAISGGADSMILLRACVELQARFDWRLVVAHFHHQLRGADANADQELVARTAAAHALTFVPGTADVRGVAMATGESLETAARRLRHAFLARIAREHGCDPIAVAHHANDQTELFLMRLLRGAGGGGLGGMKDIEASPADPGIRLVRPFLRITRARLHEAGRELGVTWRDDASNLDLSLLRNRIRHELLPLLTTRFQPAVLDVLDREQRLIRDQAEFARVAAGAWLGRSDREEFSALPVALQREVIRLQLAQEGVPFHFELIESLREFPDTPIQVDPTRRVVGAPNGTVRCEAVSRHDGAFSFAEERLLIEGRCGEIMFGGLRIEWELQDTAGDARLAVKTEVEYFNADAIGEVITLRHWRPGDRFQPIGMSQAVKVQDLFTNAHVPAGERRGRVLAATGDGEIFWIEGLRIGERAKLTAATRRRLTWRWTQLKAVETEP